MLEITGKVSWFGGPKDTGVKPGEGLALFEPEDLTDPMHKPLFLLKQPAGTSGLARRLNPDKFFVAARWDYDRTPREWLRSNMVRVYNPANGRSANARPTDWGPAEWTDRVMDLSPGLMKFLDLGTDDTATLQIGLAKSDDNEPYVPVDPRDNYDNQNGSKLKKNEEGGVLSMLIQFLVPILLSGLAKLVGGKVLEAVVKTEKKAVVKPMPSVVKEDEALADILPKKKQKGDLLETILRALIQAAVGVLNDRYPKEEGGWLAALGDTGGVGKNILEKLLK